MLKLLIFSLSISLLVSYGYAQVGLYGQCGGIGYKGSTECITGAVCTYSNEYWSQCNPDPKDTGVALYGQCGGIGYNGKTLIYRSFLKILKIRDKSLVQTG
jgi:hypothetical protein